MNRTSDELAGPVLASLGKVLPTVQVDRSISMGAAWGVVAWSAYGLVEYLICAAWPLFTVDRAVFTSLNWTLSGWLLNAYWVLGAVAGAIFGAAFARMRAAGTSLVEEEDRARLAAKLSLYVAVFAQLLTVDPWQSGVRTVLLTDAILLGSTVWVLCRPASRLAAWVAIPPLLAVLLIQIPSWLGAELFGTRGPLFRRLMMILAALAILAFGRFLSRFPQRGASSHLAANLLLLVLTACATASVSGRNRSLPQPSLGPGINQQVPPVVLISLDTTRADHLSVYGYPRKTTPNLEEFAHDATLYTDAIAAADSTLPSHGSIFTGLYPSWHGGHGYSVTPVLIRPVSRNVPTLPEILKDRGFLTLGVAANKAFLAPQWGLSRGFQTFNVQTPIEVLPPLYGYYLRHGIRRLLSYGIETMEFDAQYRCARDVNGDAFAAMEETRPNGRPFFLFLNYMDAHAPYVAEVPAGLPLPSGYGSPDFPQLWSIVNGVLSERIRYPEEIRLRIAERYDAGIAAEDAAFGDVISWLKGRGLYDRALIIVTADHGEAFGEHNLAAHGVSTYQDQVHVPLLIKYPGVSQARIVTTPVSHIDILPTVLDTLGLPIPAHLQGRSLRNFETDEERSLFSESFPTKPDTDVNPRLNRTERAIRYGSYKLILSDKGKHEFFNIADDPQELHPLAAGVIPQAQAMESNLRAMIRLIPRQPVPPPAGAEQLKPLKGLGYVR
jgi:arylsulfatase A-like enzyme